MSQTHQHSNLNVVLQRSSCIVKHWVRLCGLFDAPSSQLYHVTELPSDVMRLILNWLYPPQDIISAILHPESKFTVNFFTDDNGNFYTINEYYNYAIEFHRSLENDENIDQDEVNDSFDDFTTYNDLSILDIEIFDIRLIEEKRFNVYSNKIASMKSADFTIVIEFKYKQRLFENIFCIFDYFLSKSKPKSESQISNESIPRKHEMRIEEMKIDCVIVIMEHIISNFVEYCYDDENFYLSFMGVSGIIFHKLNQFDMWLQGFTSDIDLSRNTIDRLVENGFRSHITDTVIFSVPSHIPTVTGTATQSDNLIQQNKRSNIPITMARIWNVEKRDYDILDTSLEGAPQTIDEQNEYWQQLLSELDKKYQTKYVENYLSKQLKHNNKLKGNQI